MPQGVHVVDLVETHAFPGLPSTNYPSDTTMLQPPSPNSDLPWLFEHSSRQAPTARAQGSQGAQGTEDDIAQGIWPTFNSTAHPGYTYNALDTRCDGLSTPAMRASVCWMPTEHVVLSADGVTHAWLLAVMPPTGPSTTTMNQQAQGQGSPACSNCRELFS